MLAWLTGAGSPEPPAAGHAGGAAGAGSAPPDGTFAIKNPSSDLVLEADAHDLQTIQVWQYNGRPNQLWQYDPTKGSIFNSASGQALDLDMADQTTVIGWSRNGRPNQQWIIDPRSQTITNPATGKALGIDHKLQNGSRCIASLLLGHVKPDPAHMWQLQAVAAHGAPAPAHATGAHTGQGRGPEAHRGGGRAAHGRFQGRGHTGRTVGGGGRGRARGRGAGGLPEAVPPGVMVLTDHAGQRVRLVAHTDPGIEVRDFKQIHGLSLKLRHPIFFCPSARLAKGQRKAQPVLFMTATDWHYLRQPEVTHNGAFGSDDETWSAALFEQRFDHKASTYCPEDSDSWQVVWKFPGDLNGIPTFRRIENVPVPVGFYNFWDDGWWVPDIEPSAATAGWLPELPIGQGAVEKLRTDLPGGGSVHALESRRGVQVAAIGSGYFIDGYWEGDHPKTLPQVKAMLRELYERCGVYAFPCYGQHHAIVLYADLRTEPATLLDPVALCTRILDGDQQRAADLIEALQRGALPDKRDRLVDWRRCLYRLIVVAALQPGSAKRRVCPQ